jgi:hypothetical protein
MQNNFYKQLFIFADSNFKLPPIPNTIIYSSPIIKHKNLTMKELDFTGAGEHLDKHDCVSYQIDDWLIFKCQSCDYVRKFNWKTREMKVKGGDTNTLHSGFHAPFQASMPTGNSNN